MWGVSVGCVSSEPLHDEAAGWRAGDQRPRKGVCVAQDVNRDSAGRHVLYVEPRVTLLIRLGNRVM